MSQRSKSLGSASEKLLDHQICQFAAAFKRAPKNIQKHLTPYIFELRKIYAEHPKLKEALKLINTEDEQKGQSLENGQYIIHNYIRLLQLKTLGQILGKIIDKVQSERNNPITKKKQQIFNKKTIMQKTDLLYPDYDTYYKMSKQQRTHILPQQHPKTQLKEFFSEPRFLVRLQEFAHYRSNQKYKENILFIHYKGNVITGSKCYAVANDKAIEVWGMQSNLYPIPNLNSPSENEQREEKKQYQNKQKQQKSTEIPNNAKFSFHFKFTGHSQKITSLSFSLDEYYLISGSADRSVRLWCMRLCIPLCIYRSHSKTVWDVAFSPSGYYFVSGGADGLMILWKTDEPHAKRIYYHKNDVYKVGFTKDPAFVISAGEDGTIKIWKTFQAELFRKITLSKPVINFNLGFSGALLVAIECDGKITIVDILNGELVNSFYFYEPERKTDKQSIKNDKAIKKMMIHDIAFSEDERELSCISSKYVLIYSMDRLQMKVNKNIYSFFDSDAQNQNITKITPKEVIYMGIDTNLTYCCYQHKNVLVVAGSGRN